MKVDPIRVFEHEAIAFKGRHQNERFTPKLYKAFESYFTQNENTPFFDLIPYGVKFKQYVGAIQIGKTVIEVLPKAGKTGNKEVWQKALLDMLKECHLLMAKNTGEAHLSLRAHSILDLYFELYVKELEILIHKGLFKQYRTRQGQQLSLKGALVFSEHLNRNIIHKERFYTRHTTYDKNHVIHQILHEALLLVQRFSNHPQLADRIGRLLLDFPAVERRTINPSIFSKLPKGRKVQDYETSLKIAELLLLNYRPDLMAGHHHVLALLFDMNRLWEEYIYRILKKSMSKEWRVLTQRSQYFWENQRIRPDIVLKNKLNTYVIDTKWKVPDQGRPSDSDLKQMYVYNHHWNCQRSMLLYPATLNSKDQKGHFRLPLVNGLEHHCHLGFVEVVDSEGLRRDLGRQVMSIIE